MRTPSSPSLAKKLLLPLLGAALVAMLVAQLRGFETARASVPAAPAQPGGEAGDSRITAEGRLVAYPGAEVTIGSDLAGTVVRLLVEEKMEVKQGQLLAELRSDDVAAELAEARARVAETEADLRLYETEVARAERLAADGVIAQQRADVARRDRDAALARRETAVAAVARLTAVLAKSRILAPISGLVTSRLVDAGETVEAGEELLTIADLRRTRVEAEVDEYDAGRMALGLSVEVSAEGFPGQTWRGVIEEIPDGVTSRRIKPQDPGRPQDTRVLLVKVALAEPTPLRLGQRVEVEIGGE
ncbi:MAG TPA: efflux RND transporter periplasmic adaptor subunit [Thermoanaerobaculia bacterium]|nr:efflux RND transporter periplasmic adaptor subunit [Thermoanaerobaculia bacterium]